MSAVDDEYITNEVQLRRAYEQQREAVEGSGEELQSDISNASLVQGVIYAAFLWAAPAATLLGSLGSETLGTIARLAAPKHTGLAEAADVAGGLVGAIFGDPAAREAMVEKFGKDAIESLEKSLPEHALQTLQESRTPEQLELGFEIPKGPTARQVKNQIYKKAKELLNAETDEDAEEKVKVANKLSRASKNVYSVFVNSVLTNPRIFLQKVLTDTINQPIQTAFRAMAVADQHGNMAAVKTVQAAMGAWRDTMMEALKYAVITFKEDRPAWQQDVLGIKDRDAGWIGEILDDDAADKAAKNQPLISNAFRWIHATGKAMRIGPRAVLSADQFAKAMAFRANLRMMALYDGLEMAEKEGLSQGAKIKFADAYADNLVNHPSDALIERAKQKMFEWTFTAHGPMIQLMNRFANSFIAFRLGIPFVTVPGNILRTGLSISPFAGLSEWSTIAGNMGELERSQALAKWAVGTAIYYHFWNQAAQGNLTGDGPFGRYREFWHGRHHPRSIKIGDNWYGYEYLGPIADVLSLAADSTEQYYMTKNPNHQTRLLEAVGSALVNQVNNVSFMEWLGNVQHVLDNVKAGGTTKEIGEYMTRTAQGFIPAPVRQWAIARDPAEKETEITGTEAAQMDPSVLRAKNISNEVGNAIPGWNDNRPLKRDLWGNFIYPPTALNDEHLATYPDRVLNSISPVPFYGKEGKLDPVEQELFTHRITFNDKFDKIYGNNPQDTVPITEAQQDEWKLYSGSAKIATYTNKPMNQHDTMAWLMQQDYYKASQPANQSMLLRRVHDTFHKAGMDQIIEKHNYLPAMEEAAMRKAAPMPSLPTIPGYIPGTSTTATGEPLPPPTETPPVAGPTPVVGVR